MTSSVSEDGSAAAASASTSAPNPNSSSNPANPPTATAKVAEYEYKFSVAATNVQAVRDFAAFAKKHGLQFSASARAPSDGVDAMGNPLKRPRIADGEAERLREKSQEERKIWTMRLNRAFVDSSGNIGIWEKAPKHIRADKEIVKAAIKKHGCALIDASPEHRQDRELIMMALGCIPVSLFKTPYRKLDQFLRVIPGSLFDDEDVSRTMLQLCERMNDIRKTSEGYPYCGLQFVSSRLRLDRDFVTFALNTCGRNLKYCPADFQADKDIVLTAVSGDGNALQHATIAMREDRDVVEAAVTSIGKAIVHAEEELRNDRLMFMRAVESDGHALEWYKAPSRLAPPELRNDKEVVKAAMKSTGGIALQYASDALRDDRHLIEEAIHEGCLATATLTLVSARLLDDGGLLKRVIEDHAARHPKNPEADFLDLRGKIHEKVLGNGELKEALGLSREAMIDGKHFA